MQLIMRNEKIDHLLKNALSSAEKPDPQMVEKVKYMLTREETDLKKSTINRSLRTAVAFVAAFAVITTTAFAAWHFLSPSEVANRLDSPVLAKAFRSEDAISVNETKSQKGYDISFLGIVSGKGLTELDQTLNTDKTYAVVAIAKQGGAMPDTRDEDYNSTPFFVSPLIHGEKPWLYNIASMNGGYSAFVLDGIMYRLIECDNLEMFADRGLSLIVSSTTFYDVKAYDYDEATGLVAPNPNFEGVNLIFDLPLKKDNADFEKAQQYLDSLSEKDKADFDKGKGEREANFINMYKDEEGGLSARQFVNPEEYRAWINEKLEEMQKLVDKGEYSADALKLDRIRYESNLKEIKQGAKITLIEFDDGSAAEKIIYPEEDGN